MQVSAAVDVNLGFTFCESGLGQRVLRRAAGLVRPDIEANEQRRLAIETARLGYAGLYTPDWRGPDALGLCRLRWEACRHARADGIRVGTLVSPIPKYPDPEALAARALALWRATDGRFVLGLGAGDLDRHEVRAQIGSPEGALSDLVKSYLVRVLEAFAREVGDRGERPPVMLAAMGPRMLRVAGELADGAVLSFVTPREIAWARERIREGAARVGRDPAAIRLAQSLPVCVAADRALARRRLAIAVIPYLLGPELPRTGERRIGYRRQIERLGFASLLDELDHARRESATRDELISHLPDELLTRVGYAGPAAGAARAVSALCRGLDEAVVRITAVTERYSSTEEGLRALRPGPEWEERVDRPRPARVVDRPAGVVPRAG